MTCHDFESLWNEHLDRRATSPPELGPGLREHAESCPHCRSISLRYAVLQQVLADGFRRPAVPADFLERCLQAHHRGTVGRLPVWKLPIAHRAAAAAVVLAGSLILA